MCSCHGDGDFWQLERKKHYRDVNIKTWYQLMWDWIVKIRLNIINRIQKNNKNSTFIVEDYLKFCKNKI